MASEQERTVARSNASGKLQKLASVDVSALERSELGPYAFDDAVPRLQELLDVMRTLSGRELGRLPYDTLDEISTVASDVEELVASVQGFDPKQGDPNSEHSSILRQIENAYDSIMSKLMLPLAFTSTEATNYQELERAARGCLADIESKQDEFQSFIESSTEEATRALDELRKQVAEGGVSKNAQFFADGANKHAEAAGKWRVGTWWALVATFVYAAAALGTAYIDMGLNPTQTVQVALGKLIVLSVLSYSALWCARNYRAEKHNETLNRHRSNALQTFRTFVEGSDDPRVRDAILLHTANAAFEVRGTGYDKDSSAQSMNPVVEVLGRSLQQGAAEQP